MSTPPQPAHHTPTITSDGTHTPSEPSPASVQTSAAVALGMSWQLLVVIVLPMVGGRFLDSRFHMSPVYTGIGMALGVIGTILVIRRTVRQLNEIMNSDTKESDK
jgi:F0F1-type ATP synthase assembly protein I